MRRKWRTTFLSLMELERNIMYEICGLITGVDDENSSNLMRRLHCIQDKIERHLL